VAGEPLAARRAGLRGRLVDAGGSALLVLHSANIRYLTGFGGGGVLLLMADGSDILVVVRLNEAEARMAVGRGIALTVAAERPLETARECLAGHAGPVVFEKDRLSVAQYETWESAGGPRLEGVSGWVEALRAVKSTLERETIARAAELAVDAFDAVLDEIRPGVTELQLVTRLERELRERGSERFPFDTIVQFGERAALPHADPGARALARGEVVLFDFGAVVDGYVSDVSRTVACGAADHRLKEAYRVADLARRAAMDGLKAGIEGRGADGLAREVIEDAGFGPAFLHSLGHGIGLEVHEDPRLWRGNADPVPDCAVVTLEPGIYIEGLGGIRIEDDFVVGTAGARPLTRTAPDELLVL
jgi:Xaa-Pro aminopeptidase